MNAQDRQSRKQGGTADPIDFLFHTEKAIK
jgi:hypothetical protein